MNRQSFITILLTIFMSITGVKAFAHDIEAAYNGKIIYYVWANNNTELAVSYRGSDEYSYSNEYTDNVVIPESVDYNGNTYPVTSIGEYAFSYSHGMTSVTIPNSVTSIGGSAFRNCSGLTSITIPNSVTSIGGSAFMFCSGLTSINVESGNPNYDSPNNCNAIIETASNTLIVGCKYTTIPNSVESIGEWAFSGCSGLTSVTIPNCVTSIGEGAFSGCSSLTSVSIPDGVTSIGNNAFSSCSGLTSVTIPNGVTSIGSSAFEYCSGLTSVNIPDGVTSIGDYAFSGCRGLTSVTIPKNVTSIGQYAFNYCSGLTSVSIPDGVTSIGKYSFLNCNGLTSVTIPSSVTSIGRSAFSGCTSILLVRSFITEPYSIDKSVFPNEVYRQSTLYIPAGTEKLYTRFDGWREFLKIEEMDSFEEQEIPGAEKCAMPTINYENNKLSFSCQTEGVEYKYKIESNDVKEGFGNDIQMTRTYKVTVIAFKDGMNNSDPAIIIIGKKGDVNGDDKVDVADHVELSKIIMEQGQ